MTIISKIHSTNIFPQRVQALATNIASMLPDGARILDFGCGDGTIAELIMNLREDIEIIGLDVLQRSTTKLPVIIYDGKKIPFDDRHFDGVMLVDVLHHDKDPLQLLLECSRVSRKFILIKDHVLHGIYSKILLGLMDWVGNKQHGVNLTYNYLTEPQWTSIFEETGLREVIRKEQLGLYSGVLQKIFERNLHFLSMLEVSNGNIQFGN